MLSRSAAEGSENSGATPRLQEQFGYGYDKAGNLNERTNNALIQSFAVNDVNELSSASHSGTLTVAGTATEPGSDVTSVTVNGQSASVYQDGSFAAPGFTPTTGENTYTAIAQDNVGVGRLSTNSVTVNVLGGADYTYDLNGNLLSDGTRNFAYDDENQLIAVWEANSWSNSFAYDGLMRKRVEQEFVWNGSGWTETNEVHYVYDGNRASKTVGGATTYYLVDDANPSGYSQVLEEYRGTSLTNVYNYGLSLISQRQPGVSTNYFISDGHGSTRMSTDISGTIVSVLVYDAYGNLIASNGMLQTAYLYSGQQYDFDLELYLDRARYLNTGTGRFWTMDTEDGNNEDPLSLHKYLYAEGDSVNLGDPSGHDEIGVGLPGSGLDAMATVTVGAPIVEEEVAYGAAVQMAGRSILSGLIQSIGITALLAQELGLFGYGEGYAMQIQIAERLNPTGSPHAYVKYECDLFALDAVGYYTKAGQAPQIITYDSYSGKTVGDNIMAFEDFGLFGGENISRNGHHEGVLVGGLVFDNNVPFGVPRRAWEHGYFVTPLKTTLDLNLREANDQGYGVLNPNLH